MPNTLSGLLLVTAVVHQCMMDFQCESMLLSSTTKPYGCH